MNCFGFFQSDGLLTPENPGPNLCADGFVSKFPIEGTPIDASGATAITSGFGEARFGFSQLDNAPSSVNPNSFASVEGSVMEGTAGADSFAITHKTFIGINSQPGSLFASVGSESHVTVVPVNPGHPGQSIILEILVQDEVLISFPQSRQVEGSFGRFWGIFVAGDSLAGQDGFGGIDSEFGLFSGGDVMDRNFTVDSTGDVVSATYDFTFFNTVRVTEGEPFNVVTHFDGAVFAEGGVGEDPFSASVDSTNTSRLVITSPDPNVSFLIIPEPAILGLLGISVVLIVGRPSRRGQ